MLTPNPNGTYTEAVDMLERLRPGGPWILTAIIPDGSAITTITATTADKVRKFISDHNGKRNPYFSVNATRRAMDKKASKLDLAAIEYIHNDLDPRDDENPENAKARYHTAIEAYALAAAEITDSGNGMQVLYRLAEPIKLEKPEMLPDENGELTLQFPKETELKIAEVEGCAKLLMQSLGSVAGTQNIDRILRLPGTTNLPNATKLKHGRTECQTKSISFSSASHPFESFPKPKVEPKVEHAPQKGELSDKDFVIWLEGTLSPDQIELISKSIWKGEKVRAGDTRPGRDRSAQFHHAVCWLKDKGCRPECGWNSVWRVLR